MDRETVITHLQIIHTWAKFARERDLQFFTAKHLEDIAQWSDDALALLKEQEAVTEYVIDDYQPTCKACGFRPYAGYIPTLEWMRERGFKYCPQCGQAVTWQSQKKG